ILHSLNNPKLSDLVRKSQTKESLVSVLETYAILEHHEVPEQKPHAEVHQNSNLHSSHEYDTPQHEQIPINQPSQSPQPRYQSNLPPNNEKFFPKPEFEMDSGEDEETTEAPMHEKVENYNVNPHHPDTHFKMPSESASEEILSEAEVRRYADIINHAISEIHKVFIGQENTVEKVMLALMCDAHALLEGVPGLAKSLLVEVLSNIMSGTSFHRIQFLPDMLPADVIGGQIYNPKTSTFVTVKGPIFANFVLADEINRAPPKTHAALMEAMQEKKINIDKDEFKLDRPFLVLATQNPLENKGTYELPEAVVDRFMFKIDLPYPSRKHEKIIITENATTKSIVAEKKVEKIIDKQDFLEMQRRVKFVHISEKIKDYILDLIEATRGTNKKIEGIQFVKYGGGPRASIYLGIAAKAAAIMKGRNYVLPEDIEHVAPEILRHRVILNFKGKAYNISSDKIIEEILAKVNPE
ncbi:MoxR family ATPase, partial [Candidatus Woesearchaeota archaeon]|nr:MoxR family ATPase [Candidatus Woesearchaeota archaeon]